MRTLALTLFAVFTLGGCLLDPSNAGGGRQWTQAAGTDAGPGPMQGAKLTYDGDRNKVVMYTGRSVKAMTMLGQVYEWTEGQWKPICNVDVANQPPAVYLPGFAWDPKRHELVLAGGARDFPLTQLSKEVWTCDVNNAWHHQAVTITTPRTGAELVWNDGVHELFLIGGRDANGMPLRNMEMSTDLLSWDQQQSDHNEGLPIAGAGESATYDDDSHRIIAIASVLANGNEADQLHDELWQLADDSVGDGFTSVCAMCRGTDTSDSTIVHFGGHAENWMFGGYIGSDLELPGSWLLDHNRPLPVISNMLGQRNGVGAAYDVMRDRIVAFGGAGQDCAQTQFECGETFELQ